jgi:manganese-dependent inorganic pyrophosphatase
MIYITGHTFPTTDLDSIASSILIPKYIERKYNLKSKAIYFGSKNTALSKLIKSIGFDFPKNYKINNIDLFIFVDHNRPNLSIDTKRYTNRIFGIIDHHRDKNTKYMKFKIIKKIGSCATIIYYLYKKNNIEISSKEAKLFYYAIVADTLGLAVDATRKQDRLAIAELIKKYKKLPSYSQVFKEVFFLNTKNSIKAKLLEDEKVTIYKNHTIVLSNIKTNGEPICVVDIKKYLKNKFDLNVIMILDLKNKTTAIHYFGKLAIYFKDNKYNKLRSRKRYLVPFIERKLDDLKI